MKAIPFIDTMLDETYRVLVSQPFNLDDVIKIFDGWNDKDMVGWRKFTNKNKTSFEFYGEGNPYKIKNQELVGDKSFTFPYPKNINLFICDCQRCSVSLHWKSDIIDSINRIVFMERSEIENYNTELLTKIDKI